MFQCLNNTFCERKRREKNQNYGPFEHCSVLNVNLTENPLSYVRLNSNVLFHRVFLFKLFSLAFRFADQWPRAICTQTVFQNNFDNISSCLLYEITINERFVCSALRPHSMDIWRASHQLLCFEPIWWLKRAYKSQSNRNCFLSKGEYLSFTCRKNIKCSKFIWHSSGNSFYITSVFFYLHRICRKNVEFYHNVQSMLWNASKWPKVFWLKCHVQLSRKSRSFHIFFLSISWLFSLFNSFFSSQLLCEFLFDACFIWIF